LLLPIAADGERFVRGGDNRAPLAGDMTASTAVRLQEAPRIARARRATAHRLRILYYNANARASKRIGSYANAQHHR
jgi:hypothetical protein